MKNDCSNCNGKCCRYVAVEIDKPTTLKDFENIKWFVCHKNVNVFIDDDNSWFLEFLTSCRHLDKNNRCNNYLNRPQICRDYSTEECTFHNDYSQKQTFSKIEDVEEYIKQFKKKKNKLPAKS